MQLMVRESIRGERSRFTEDSDRCQGGLQRLQVEPTFFRYLTRESAEGRSRQNRSAVRRPKVKRCIVPFVVAVALMIGAVPAALAGTNGNGAPSGPHYNLNLIGFANGDNVKDTT